MVINFNIMWAHPEVSIIFEKITIYYNDVIMSVMASQIISLSWTVYSGADQRKHQSSAWLAFVWGIHRGPVNYPHKWPVTRKIISVWWRHHDYYNRSCFDSLRRQAISRHDYYIHITWAQSCPLLCEFSIPVRFRSIQPLRINTSVFCGLW